MESVSTEGTRALFKSEEGRTRWTRGKSGFPALSSSGSPSKTHFDSNKNNKHNNSNRKAAAASSSTGKRRQTRVSTALKMENGANASSAWSATLDTGEKSCSPKSFPVPASPSTFQAAALSVKTKTSFLLSSSSASPTFVFSTREEKSAAPADLLWSVASTSKRGALRKDRRHGKSSLSVPSNGRAKTRSAVARNMPFLCDVNHDGDMRGSDAGTNLFAFPMQQSVPNRGSGRANSSLTFPRSNKVNELATADTHKCDVDGKLSRISLSACPLTSSTVAPKASTTSSFDSQSLSTVDPLAMRARAVLQDCIRTRKMEQSNARKRSIEGCFNGDLLEGKCYDWHDDWVSKPMEYGSVSPRSSCSSDDELKQFSSMDQPVCSEKSERSCDSKLAKEEMYRQILVGGYDLSSSPEFRCFSPLFEEKGLPIEVRYQLPLALGTANETSKECAICQLYYGIGDHIVTLPCQHFFHACCVDKWLWDHTSCPLCRTEVTLDQMTESPSITHNFTECSPMDRERIRRQMRSSSQHAGFRSVVPAKIDELELAVSRIAIDEDSEVEDDSSCLVCPTPHLASNVQDK